MKIREIITEAEEQNLEKGLDAYFKKKELEKKRAELRGQPRVKAAQPAEPEGDDPYSKTLSRVNAPKSKEKRDIFAKAFQKGWHRGEEFKQGVKQAYDKVTSHRLFRPK